MLRAGKGFLKKGSTSCNRCKGWESRWCVLMNQEGGGGTPGGPGSALNLNLTEKEREERITILTTEE